MKKNDPTWMVVVCKTPSCDYKLQAKATGYRDAWLITKQDKSHRCRFENTKNDHAYLSTSIIGDVG